MAAGRKLAAGNWKMHGTGAELGELRALVRAHPEPGCEVLICPPATLIHRAAEVVRGSAVMIGGQDCHAEAAGAHTGDVSAAMLADAGASHVILGHSERRADHGESDAAVAAKLGAAQAAGLVAVVCVGETLEAREAGRAEAVVAGQLAGSLGDDTALERLVVAYEPVWAIGTGRTASVDDIAAMHRHIRARLAGRFGPEGEAVRLLYGGSVKPGNAAEIFAAEAVDGALVGGASLKAADFSAIVAALEAA